MRQAGICVVKKVFSPVVLSNLISPPVKAPIHSSFPLSKSTFAACPFVKFSQSGCCAKQLLQLAADHITKSADRFFIATPIMSHSGGRGRTVFDLRPRFAQVAVVGRPYGQGQGKRQHGSDADDQCGTSMSLHVARFSFLCESYLIQCGSYLERGQTRVDAYGYAAMLHLEGATLTYVKAYFELRTLGNHVVHGPRVTDEPTFGCQALET